MGGLTKAWDMLVQKECSKMEALPPMVCNLVTNKDLEKKAVDGICSKQTMVPAAECEAGLAKLWDLLAQKECSKIEIASSAIPPVVCKLAENQDLEKKAIGALCTRQQKVPASECEAVLTKFWDMLAQKECAKATDSTTIVV